MNHRETKMTNRLNITHYFENILNSIKNMEQNAHIFSQLHTLAEELSQLEQYVKESFETLDNHFQAYIKQINLLSGLIEFQRKVIHFKTPEEVQAAVFEYLKEYVPYNHAFIFLKFSGDNDKGRILTDTPVNEPIYQKFLFQTNSLKKLRSFLFEKDLGVLLSDVHQFKESQLPWELLNANSAILFPLRMQGKFFGIGILTSSNRLLLNHLSFINLISGMLALLLYQHYYFFQLKRRLFKQAKLQKVMEEIKYTEYFERGPLSIFSLDQRGIVLHANEAGLQSLQYSKEQIVGEKFLSFIPQQYHKAFENALNQLMPDELRFFRCPVKVSEDTTRIWDFYMTRLELSERFSIHSLLAIDVTTHYYKEQQEKKEEVLEEISQFTRVMMGNLNHLLSVLVPNLSYIKSQLPEEHPLQSNLKVMEKTLDSAERLVQKIVNYNPDEVEKVREVNLNSLILDIVDRFKETFTDNIEFKISLDPSIPTISTYPNQIIQLIRIFTQNSLEAIKAKGYIKISTQTVLQKRNDLLSPHMFYLPKGKYIEICFEDNGTGIDPKLEPHIFKPFHSNKIKNEGVGLGLFLAYNIIKGMNGHVFVRSKPGNTRFHVYLPIQGMQEISSMMPAEEKKVSSDTPRLLIVDDEYNIRSMLQEVFEMKGYKVYTAANGKEAVDIYDQHQAKIDLVILDMVMPVMDGKTTFKELKKRNKDQKILVISGYSEREDLQEILQNGVLGFLSKPFQLNEIINKVESIIKEKE